MGKLRTGPAISLVKSSKGTSSNEMDFYATTYSSVYNQDDFTPKTPKRKGTTGYLATFQPGITYSAGLDILDNVPFGKLIEDNYESSYSKSHRQYCNGSNGRDQLPTKILPRKSGFTQQEPFHFPNSTKVMEARKNSQTNNVYKTLLKKISHKNVPHLDNGSLTLATETGTCYLGHPSEQMETNCKDIGKDEPSGFTHYHHVDPVLYRPRQPFDSTLACRDGLMPTGISEHQEHFLHWPTLYGNEINPGIRPRTERHTGYTYETAKPRYAKRHTADAFTKITDIPYPVTQRIQKQDPCELVNLMDETGHKTLASCWMRGQQRPTQDLETRLRKFSRGGNEMSGYSTNNGSYVRTKDDRSFKTHYGVKFGSKAEYYKGEVGVQDFKQTNGFTKSTRVHRLGDGAPFQPTTYSKLHPLIAKVVKLDHPCYTDNTKDLKLRDSLLY